VNFKLYARIVVKVRCLVNSGVRQPSNITAERKDVMTVANLEWGTFAGVEVPLACDLQAIPQQERVEHLALADRLYGRLARERRVEEDGVAFRFDAADYDAVTRYVANERLCCSFVRFEIVVAPNHGPIWLRVAGGEEMSALMQELTLAGAEG
jgi:hypothetical protein